MPSVSLCVRMVFRGERPSDEWLGARCGLGPGYWLPSTMGGRSTRYNVPLGGWEAMWLCRDWGGHIGDGTVAHYLDVGHSIEHAWALENAPKVQPAATAPAAPVCPACHSFLRTVLQRTPEVSDPNNVIDLIRLSASACDHCGFIEQRQRYYPKPST